MFAKMTRILMLSASLLMAGAAGAADRSVNSGPTVAAAPTLMLARNDHYDRHHYRRPPPPPREYRKYHPPVRYVPVHSRHDHRRYAPPPPPRHYKHYDHRR